MILDRELIPKGHNAANMFVVVKGDAAKFIRFVEEVMGGKERAGVRTPDRDGSLIHAEVQLGDATIMVADAKDDWPFTPAFIQVYVQDIQAVLDRAQSAGASVVTPRSPFYGGFNLARLQDPWGNIWWLYEPNNQKTAAPPVSDTSWHDRKPSEVYTTLLAAMRGLGDWGRHRRDPPGS
jgi:PhnB protein